MSSSGSASGSGRKRKQGEGSLTVDNGNKKRVAQVSAGSIGTLATKFDQLHRALADVLDAEASDADWESVLGGDTQKVDFVRTLKALQQSGDIPWANSPPPRPTPPQQPHSLPIIATSQSSQTSSNIASESWPPPLPPITNPDLALQTITHSSWVDQKYPNNTSEGFQHLHYQRLEFLGDAAIHYILSKHIYHQFSDNRENILSAVRTSIECNNKLAEYSHMYKLPARARLGKDAINANSHKTTKFAADMFEAYIGALILDSKDGLEVVDRFLKVLVGPMLRKNTKSVGDNYSLDRTAKQTLWNAVGGCKGVEILYEWTDGKGGNSGGFWYTAFLKGYGFEKKPLGKGWGSNKNDASLKAAMEALKDTELIDQLKEIKAKHVDARREGDPSKSAIPPASTTPSENKP